MMKKYRNEWKYSCTNAELASIEAKLGSVLPKDSHIGTNGKYGVHSLYFDDQWDTCAKETEAGDAKRFKYRIRYYDHDASFLRLERKEKLNGGCHKISCRISKEEYEKLFTGDVTDFLYSETKPLLRQFAADILARRFTPRAIVDYERVAFVEPITNVRITMDYCISASHQCDRFLQGDYLRIPLMSKDQHILEVKFDDILPGYIKQSVYENQLQQRMFSKYYFSYQIIRSFGR